LRTPLSLIRMYTRLGPSVIVEEELQPWPMYDFNDDE